MSSAGLSDKKRVFSGEEVVDDSKSIGLFSSINAKELRTSEILLNATLYGSSQCWSLCSDNRADQASRLAIRKALYFLITSPHFFYFLANIHGTRPDSR